MVTSSLTVRIGGRELPLALEGFFIIPSLYLGSFLVIALQCQVQGQGRGARDSLE